MGDEVHMFSRKIDALADEVLCRRTSDRSTQEPETDFSVCEICGSGATDTYAVDMFRVIDKGYAPPFGKSFKYQKKRVRVPCCSSCLRSIARGNAAVSLAILLIGMGVYVFAFKSIGLQSVLQHIVAFLFSLLLTGFFGFPLFWFISWLCGENRLCRKSKTIKTLKGQGWKIGKKPGKSD